MKSIKGVVALLVLAIIIFGAFIVYGSKGIKPVAWQPLKTIPTHSRNSSYNLPAAEKIPINGMYGPEDFVFDNNGNLYTGVHIEKDDFSNGKILKISSEGKVEVFYEAGSWVAGLHFDEQNNLLALSHKDGLISISPDKKVSVLVSEDLKSNFFFIPNGMDVASDGSIYFSNTSDEAPYTIGNGRKLILEMIPHGGLYRFIPSTNRLETLIDGTYFGNGVVLSRDESYVLMVETGKYRVLKYWLKGDKAGKIEVFLDNLQGFPNGISIREDGSYWLGFSTKRNKDLDDIHPNPFMKKVVYALPEWLQPQPEKFGMIMNISGEGEILHTIYDTTGNVFPEAGAVKEYQGYLYIGGDQLPYIGKYKLKSLPAVGP